MKKYILLVLIFSIIISCKEETSSKDSIYTKEKLKKEISTENAKDSSLTTEESELDERTKNGDFQRIDTKNNNTACVCNCVTISLEQVIILCIDEEAGIKIEVKFKSINESKLAMYYVHGEGKMKGQKEIPWEDFDKNSPLAIVNFTSPNNFELDWKGFTKNGELAIDYALLGKKNLEGNYKRK